MSEGALKCPSGRGPNAADLALKMLVALHVDPKCLENTDPQVMRDAPADWRGGEY